MNPASTLDAAQRVGSGTPATILALAAIVLAAALVWVTRELLTSERARRADTERLLTIQGAREQTVVAALDAINELPDLVRSIREELGRREESAEWCREGIVQAQAARDTHTIGELEALLARVSGP